MKAQTDPILRQKLDVSVRKSLKAQDSIISVIIKTSDSKSVASEIHKQGFPAIPISEHVLTARIPQHLLLYYSTDKRIAYIEGSRKAIGEMEKVRTLTGADKVQSGEGLSTPYTGKGVVVGIIDQGFEYRHIAFLDSLNQPRVKLVWNRIGYGSGNDTEPTSNIPANGDGLQTDGHATHVTNIAAGSVIPENRHYGIAPNADIIMIPSTFNDTEILEDVKCIKDYAEAKGEPWVVNMSFGGQIGPHDGTTYFDQAMDQLLTNKKGGAIVAAVGNDGITPIHVSHTFEKDTTTVSFLVNSGNSSYMLLDIWGQNTDSLSHLSVIPFIYHDGQKDYSLSKELKSYMEYQIAPYNQKENFNFDIPVKVVSDFGKTACLGIDVKGADDTFHAWINTYSGTINNSEGSNFLTGDRYYTIGEIGACIPFAISVAAYNGNESYQNSAGETIHTLYGNYGDICSFSNKGPALNGINKPTVAAPGSGIISAISKYTPGFSSSDPTLTDDIKRKLKHYYYGGMSGTSMATPVVTGAVALWLEANPNLTVQQLQDIFQYCSKKDDQTGNDIWNTTWGYGKLDIYDGLKYALQLADATGIPTLHDSKIPVTLKLDAQSCHILCGSDEDHIFADLFTLEGTKIRGRKLYHLLRGEEHTLDFSNLKKGIYIVRIQTANSSLTRKFTIK